MKVSIQATVSDKIRPYLEVTKPMIVSLLVYTALAAAIAARPKSPPWDVILLAVIGVMLGSAACNTLTNYHDRDIDRLMRRTAHRVIPSGRINPPEKALYYGLVLASLSLIISYLAHPLSALMMFIGIMDNVVVYSLILKRRSPLNIILGGISGGMPVLVGYTAVAGTVDLTALLMAILVIIWIPTHIWSFSLEFKDDYQKAQVPMLPVVVEESTAIRIIGISTLIMVAFTLAIYFTGSVGLLYLITAAVLGGISLWLIFRLLLDPTSGRAWTLFKFTSPYLYIIFTALMIDRFIAV